MAVVDEKGREKERYPVVYGARVLVEDGAPVKANQILLEWDPYTFSILTEVSGTVHFKDLVEGLTLPGAGGRSHRPVAAGWSPIRPTKSGSRPSSCGRRRARRGEAKKYLMPTHAHLMVRDGDEVHAGDVLAKIPRETTKTKDITGGLPRVVELFEARKPRETAIITEINGVVKYGEISKGQRKIYVVGDDGEQREYSLPRGVHINVQEGERVKAGEPLMDGPRNPHDILDVLGEKELQKYLVNEIQEVYRLQGVNINDKHLEVIVRQMMRWVKVEDIGDTEFLPEEVVDKFKFREENERVIEAGGRPAQGRAVLLGITKASLSTDSFISAASFQETTRVLTEAAINGKVDYLRGLKENVIMGRLIPAGTGMEYYRRVKIAGEDVVEEPVVEPSLEAIPGLRRGDPPAVRRRSYRGHRRGIAGGVSRYSVWIKRRCALLKRAPALLLLHVCRGRVHEFRPGERPVGVHDLPLAVPAAIDFGRVPAHRPAFAVADEIERQYAHIARNDHFGVDHLPPVDVYLALGFVIECAERGEAIQTGVEKRVEIVHLGMRGFEEAVQVALCPALKGGALDG